MQLSSYVLHTQNSYLKQIEIFKLNIKPNWDWSQMGETTSFN